MKKNKMQSFSAAILTPGVVFLLFLASCSSGTTGPQPPHPAQNGPYISSFSPTKAATDSIVTINGRNFSTYIQRNIVKFGEVKASIKSAAENKLKVIVPKGLNPNVTYKITTTVDGETATASARFSVDIGGGSEIPPDVVPEVPQDGILEAVTWNLEWFGSTRNGPKDEPQQVTNVITILDSMKADLYAFEEVYNQDELDKISSHMKGYHGFTSHFSTYDDDDVHTGFSQQTAFLFNTNAIDSVSSGLIKEGQDPYDWASGRYPLYFQFNYKYKNISIPFYAVVIHAKANFGNDPTENKKSYERRMRAANELHAYLQNQHPGANIIFMGDFNDDTDVSIYDESSPSPYKVFVDDTDNFKTVTKSLTNNGESSYISGNYSDLIDQIIISDDVVPYYITSSIEIYGKARDFVQNYVHTTSDHLPVWAKYDITR